MTLILIFIIIMFALFLIFRIIKTNIKERTRISRLEYFENMTPEQIEAVTKYESIPDVNINVE